MEGSGSTEEGVIKATAMLETLVEVYRAVDPEEPKRGLFR